MEGLPAGADFVDGLGAFVPWRGGDGRGVGGGDALGDVLQTGGIARRKEGEKHKMGIEEGGQHENDVCKRGEDENDSVQGGRKAMEETGCEKGERSKKRHEDIATSRHPDG